MKLLKLLFYYVVTAIYSALIGFVAWSFLFVVNSAVTFLWLGTEEGIHDGFMYEHKLFIPFFIISISLILAKVYTKMGVYPKPGIEYAKEYAKHNSVCYKDFFKIYILAFVPLMLGSSVGPEAALIGLFFMMSSFISDKTEMLENKMGLDLVTNDDDKLIKRLKENKLYLIKIIITYVTVAYTLLTLLDFDRFPTFYVKMNPVILSSYSELLYIIPFVLFGFVLAKIFTYIEHKTEHLFDKIDNLYIKSLISSSILSIFVLALPVLITSGEENLHRILDEHIVYTGLAFLGLALLKIVITNVCISGNLRGGHIFPIIYTAFLAGAGLSIILNTDLTLTIASVCIGMVATIFTNYFAVFMLLALFFPTKIMFVIFIVLLILRESLSAESDKKEL